MSDQTTSLSTGHSFQPVSIEISGDHAYKSRGKRKGGCGFVMADGSQCMRAMTHHSHLSLPISLNVALAKDIHYYRSMKEAWQAVVVDQLRRSDLPAGWATETNAPKFTTPCIGSVMVEAVLTFPIARFARDQGNFRWFLEKVLGDALTEGGWLEDDCIYPRRLFDFGGLEIEHFPGVSRTRMMIFPSP